MFCRVLSLALLTCVLLAASARADGTTLEDTRWRLVSLFGAQVEPGKEDRTLEAHVDAYLVLDAQEGRYAVTAGCNRLMGSYTIDGQALTFGLAMMTLMACPEPLMKRDQTLSAMLSVVRGWRIAGQNLELLDVDGAPVAAFEAVYLK